MMAGWMALVAVLVGGAWLVGCSLAVRRRRRRWHRTLVYDPAAGRWREVPGRVKLR